ncbi:MAG: autotransporter outer membrane beta-barrel domain-containing protein [Verrucomicrobiales bacterium]|nr:autotransporter outer membrane beta-barrel domain-containing protein [Verrucomicrobiales bacterium]
MTTQHRRFTRILTIFLLLGWINLADAAPFPTGPTGDLTVTVREQANGTANFELSGSTTAKTTTSISETPRSGGNPPHTGPNATYFPSSLTFTNATTSGSDPITEIRIESSTWYLHLASSLSVTSGDTIAGSGSQTGTMVPFTGFVPGSFPIIGPDFDFTYIVIPLAQPPAQNGTPPSEEDPVIVVNTAAINSANSALGFFEANQGVIQNIYHTALGDLNDRLFNARNNQLGGSNGSNGITRSTGNDSRYLNFARNQNIDYRVALGLADGREIEVVDTLATAEARGGYVGSPFAMLGGTIPAIAAAPIMTKAVVVDAHGGGKENIHEGKAVIPEEPTRYEIFTEFDYGFYEQDRLSSTVRGFDIDSYAATLGFEYQVNDWLQVGVAWSHAWSDAELTANLGGIDVEGQLATAYFTAFHGNTYLDLLYSYGNFDNDTNRNTGLGTRAIGATESYSHNIAANLGHNIELTDRIVTGPFAGLDYASGEVDGYTERGGGVANLIFPENDYESMIGRVGWAITHSYDNAKIGRITSQFRAGWAHEFMPDSDTYSATLATSPFALVSGGSVRSIGGFTATGGGAHPGQDWLELGTGIRFDFDRNWNLRFDYEGQFGRNNASAHFGTVRLGYEW